MQPGQTEQEIALAVERAVRDLGADGVSFDTIVAGGPWAAMPHASPRPEPIAAGGMLVIDMGAQCQGYCSDLTRTPFVGDADVRFREIYEIVFDAQRAAIEGVEAGMPGSAAHELAHAVIWARGYGDAFGTGSGTAWGSKFTGPYLEAIVGGYPRRRDGVHHRAGDLHPRVGRRSHRGRRHAGEWQGPRAQPRTKTHPGGSTTMISTGELKKGATIEHDGKLYSILDYNHIKMGRGSAQVRIKLRDVRSGSITEQTFQAGTKWPRARVERREMQYLYSDDQFYYFMNTENYEQIPVGAEKVGDANKYLKENDTCEVVLYGDEVIGVELPITVSDGGGDRPRFRGDTATGGNKPAKLETGLTINVPLFIEEGARIRVNTDTGQYIERVQ
jgi:elongation factor P